MMNAGDSIGRTHVFATPEEPGTRHSAGRRAVLALLLCITTGAVLAATPPSGTVSETATVVAWTGAFVTPTGGACGGANNAACDNFRLSIVPPSYPFVVDIKLQPMGDWDLEVYDPNGVLVPGGTSGNQPTIQEEVILNNPAAGTYTVTAVPFAPAPTSPSYTASATILHGPPPPQSGSEPITYFNYVPPSPFGRDAAEPSGGINWKTDKYFALSSTTTLRVTWDDCSSPATATWDDVSFPLTSATTADPILFTDSVKGRTFVSQLAGETSLMAFTDDDGATWTASQGAGIPSGEDHQSVGGGIFHDPLTRDPNGTLYSNVVYYCSQANASAFCARSDTGGISFGNGVPLYTLVDCNSGIHGHVKVAPNDGTVYVPNKDCGEQAVIVNDTNNLQPWVIRRIPGSSAGAYDPSVAIATDGTVYFGYGDGDGHPKVAVSHDKGATWPIIADVGVPFGLQNTAFPEMVAGDPNRAAFAFLGTTAAGDPGTSDTNWPGPAAIWHLYVAHTYDGGATWTTVDATPNDPVQRGSICNRGFGPTGCSGARNLLDFNDVEVDRQGRVVVTYADGCAGSCVDGLGPSNIDLLTVARQVNGKRLFAAWDNLDVPAAPLGNATLDANNHAIVHLTWSAPDDHGSPITGYSLYRRTAAGPYALLVAVPGGQHAYDDTIDPAQSYFYKITARNNVGEGPFCGEMSPTGAAVSESPCVPPGLTVLTDAQGDYDSTLGSNQYDLLSVSMAGAFLSEGPPRLVVTMKVDNLQSPPLNTAWRTIWTSPGGTIYWVDMDTFAAGGAITFNYGTATTLPTGGLSFAPVGAADSGTFSADGTIKVTIATSKVGSTQPGQTLGSISAETELFIGGGGTGSLRIIDAAQGPGSYLVAGCGSQAPDAVDDSAFTPFDTPVTVFVLANDTDPQSQPLTVLSVTQPPNGSAVNNGDGSVGYTPIHGFSGTDSFTYTVGDPDGFTDVASVFVSVGQCTADPTFAGVASVAAPPLQTCALDLAWGSATSHCPGAAIRYNVYRSLDPGFVPSLSNAVALRVSGTSYRDANNLSSGVTYYYIVRAEDSTSSNGGPGNGGNEETNLTRASGVPKGPLAPVPNFFDNAETAVPGYQTTNTRTTGGWTAMVDPTAHSANNSWTVLDEQPGAPPSTPKDASLIMPPLTLSSTSVLTFWHNFDFARFITGAVGTRYQSGAILEISADGGSTWRDLGADASGNPLPYITPNQARYSGVIDPAALNPLSGRKAWIGSSDGNDMMAGRTDAMKLVTVNVGQAIQDFYGVTTLQGARIRFRLGGTFQVLIGGVQGTGWGVDDVTVTNLLGPGPCITPPPNPAGAVPESSLRVVKAAGGEITLTWGTSCSSTDTDYEVYEGTLQAGGFYSHTSKFCSTGGATTKMFTPSPGSTYYLVVSRNADREGSYGHASSGAERPQGASACVQQSLGTCPP